MLPLLFSFLSGLVAGILVLQRYYRFIGATTQQQQSVASSRPRAIAAGSLANGNALPVEGGTSTTGCQQGVHGLQDSIADFKADLEELREQVAYQHESDAEKLQDQSELLFSTWSEALKEELEQRQEKVIQHAEGQLLAADIKMQHLDELAADLKQKLAAIQGLSMDMGATQVAIRKLQELALRPEEELLSPVTPVKVSAIADNTQNATQQHSPSIAVSKSADKKSLTKSLTSPLGSGRWQKAVQQRPSAKDGSKQ